MTYSGLFACACLVLTSLAEATVVSRDLEVAGIFASHMVLQRGEPVPIWGHAQRDETVSITLDAQTQRTTADHDGAWRVLLPSREAGGPHRLVIEAQTRIVLEDVWFGDVWICGGQSNMARTVATVQNAKDEIARANDSAIRQFDVRKRIASEVQTEIRGAWSVASPRTVKGFTGTGYFFARAYRSAHDVPIGLIRASWGGTPIEPWMSAAALRASEAVELHEEIIEAKSQNQPKVLFNGMIAALADFPVRGFLWYQGESNATRAEGYGKKFIALIDDWRRCWGGEPRPFVFCQLAGIGRGKAGDDFNWPWLREQQATGLRRPATAMAVLTDIGDGSAEIHPPNKQEIGRRLALLVRRHFDGENIVAEGPVFGGAERVHGGMRVHFKSEAGLRIRPASYSKLVGFCVAGEDRLFYPADAVFDDKGGVVVSSAAVSEPVAIRYGWSNLATGNLENEAGLPAAPFRTDDWPRGSERYFVAAGEQPPPGEAVVWAVKMKDEL